MAKLETDPGVPAKEQDFVRSDVARASTLQSTAYLDPAVLEQENDRIFYRTWQLVAHMSELARVGDFKPASTSRFC
jgi:hypothetical protein